VTGILSVLSGIKNIYDIHTAKTADVLFQNTAALKQDTANTGLSIMGIVGGKATVKGGNGLKNTISKYPKTFGKRAFLNMKNGLIRTLTWAPRTVKALFRKETWTGLYASLKKFMSRNSDEVLENKAPYNPANGSNKKTSTTGGDHTPDKKTTAPHDKNTDSDLPKTNKADEEPDLDNLKKHEGEVDDATKKKMKDETDKDIPDGPNKDSKRKALLAAKIIAEANDKVDTPVAALLAELLPLKAFKGVTGFGAKELGGGVYRIVMYGSEFDIKKTYTPEDGPIYRGGDKIFMSDVDIRNSVNKQGFMKRKGISLNLDKNNHWVQQKGGAFEVDYSTVPDELEFMHTSGTHYEIVPKVAGVMTLERYQELVSKIKLKDYNNILP
jgi:hypothetical protein